MTFPCMKLAARNAGHAARTEGASRQNDASSQGRDDVLTRECSGRSGLTEGEIAVIAKHEHVPEIVTVELGHGLLKTRKGAFILKVTSAMCSRRPSSQVAFFASIARGSWRRGNRNTYRSPRPVWVIIQMLAHGAVWVRGAPRGCGSAARTPD